MLNYFAKNENFKLGKLRGLIEQLKCHECPRFVKKIEDVFENNQEKISQLCGKK